MPLPKFAGVFFALVFFLVAPAEAKFLPKMEFGLGYTAGSAPHYGGSNEYYYRQLPLPYFIYRTDSTNLGRGVNTFFNWGDYHISFSLGLKLPVTQSNVDDSTPDSIDDPEAVLIREKNYRRRGMRSLPWLFGVGAKIVRTFGDHFSVQISGLTFISLDADSELTGSSLTPSVAYRVFEYDKDYFLNLFYSLEYSDALLNRNSYSVTAEDVLPGRPEYEAPAGLSRASASATAGFSWGRLDVFLFVSQTDMSGTAVRESPLVISDTNLFGGVGFIYAFYHSDEKIFRGREHDL